MHTYNAIIVHFLESALASFQGKMRGQMADVIFPIEIGKCAEHVYVGFFFLLNI